LIFERAKPPGSGEPYIDFQMGEAMKLTRIAVLLFVLIPSLFAVPNAHAKLVPSPDGRTVYDTVLHVVWLADANLAGKAKGRLGVANITPGGSMDYPTALLWVDALNGLNGRSPYLGHANWQLPATPNGPAMDPSCAATGPKPYFNSFGFHCMMSTMGSLFNSTLSLDLHYPDTAVPIPYNTVGPFSNFQPYLYWSDTPSGHKDCTDDCNGFSTFSFNTGWSGSNVDGHYMYVLPMIPGKLSCTNIYCPKYHATGVNRLKVDADGLTVYDPDAVYDPTTGAKGVTWLANADLARTIRFDAQCTKPDGAKCIDRDGSMTHTTALKWIADMNAYQGVGWLGQTKWQLPPTNSTDTTEADCIPGFYCTGSPMGELFYNQLVGLSQGTPVVPTPDINVGPFNNVQPYLYWSCGAAPDSQILCGSDPAAPGFEWSFSFGNGFQGTDIKRRDLYVMVYYPETDTTTPVTTAAVAGPLGLNGWYVGPTIVNFTATDDLSGVVKTEFSLDNGAIWTTGESVSLSASAIYNILYRSTDFEGNAETPKSIIVKLDSKAPVITASANPVNIFNSVRVVPVTISGTIKDNLSGVDPTTVKFVVHDEYGKVEPTGPVTLGANGDYSFTISLRTFVKKRDADGRLYTIRVSAADNAGSARSAEATVTAKPVPPPPPCKLGTKCK
jgi:hypothetical protein